MLSIPIENVAIAEPITTPDLSSILQEFNLGTSIQDLETAQAVAQLRELNKDEPRIVFKGEKPVKAVDANEFCNDVSSWGFDCDATHKVTTSDKYELQLFNLKKKGLAAGGPVAFLQHGLNSSGNTWINNGQNSVSWQLVNAGYDVWVGNNRGSYYSRANTDVDPNKDPKKFFDYSFYELGQYDAPAQIDEVLKLTGASKLSYIGHSQGTSQMFSALAENQGSLQSKLNIFVALAPVAIMNDITESFIESLAQNWKLVSYILPLTGIYELGDPDTTPSMKGFCNLASFVCNQLQASLNSGEASEWNSQDSSDLAASRSQSAMSVKQGMHYGQLVSDTNFQKFDFGSNRSNKSHYGQTSPPVIPLESIAGVPVAYFVGKHDTLADPTDAAKGYSKVSTGVFYKEYENCDHFSFMVGKDTSFNADILAQLAKVNATSEPLAEEELPKDYPFVEDFGDLNLY